MNPPERMARLTPSIPIGRVADAGEVAKVVLFLLSEEASYIIGTEISVTGGR
jgi:NAD(P)-dependent dehydrogenase (short-subunit alcohol dehydrogenase family)